MKFTLWPFSIEINEAGCVAVVVLAVIGCLTWYNIVTPSEFEIATKAGLVQRVDRKDGYNTLLIWVKPDQQEARK